MGFFEMAASLYKPIKFLSYWDNEGSFQVDYIFSFMKSEQ